MLSGISRYAYLYVKLQDHSGQTPISFEEAVSEDFENFGGEYRDRVFRIGDKLEIDMVSFLGGIRLKKSKKD